MFYVVDGNEFTGVTLTQVGQDERRWLKSNALYVLETNEMIDIVATSDDILGDTYRKLTSDEMQHMLLSMLADLYRDKRKECLDYIADIRFTPEIDDEYNTKYKLALEAKNTGDYSAFSTDAKALSALTGTPTTPEDYCNLIISKGSAMRLTKDNVILRMGTVRVIIKALILTGSFDNARTIIQDIENMSPEMIMGATEDQILGILSGS